MVLGKDFTAVMRYPELVLKYDWPALARETGVYTNEKHLRDLALLREEPHRGRVEGARTAATAGTATSHGQW